MPLLEAKPNGYAAKANIQGGAVTFHLTPFGQKRLLEAGIQPGTKFPLALVRLLGDALAEHFQEEDYRQGGVRAVTGGAVGRGGGPAGGVSLSGPGATTLRAIADVFGQRIVFFENLTGRGQVCRR